MDSKVSIIVPVYNTAKYLHAALDSVMKQTYGNWELLLIDDGSTDGSAAICDEYAAADSRVRVIHTENHGVSCARNTGLEKATGEWISFLDSDDEMESTAIEKLLENAAGADVVIGNFRFNAEQKETIRERMSVCVPGISDQRIVELFDYDFFFTVWGKLYHRASVSCRFPPNMSYGEDTCFNLTSFWDWKRIVLIPDCVVTHYGRYGSLSNRNYLDIQGRLRAVLEQYRQTFAGYEGMQQRVFEHYVQSVKHFCWLHVRNEMMPRSSKLLLLSVWLADEAVDRNAPAAAGLSGELAEFWEMVLRGDAEGIYALCDE